MSRTYRRTRVKGQKIADKDSTKFCHHDATQILNGFRQSAKAEEKQYFEQYGEIKYNQPIKSRGGSW